MPDAAEVARRIRAAFAPVERPGNWALRGSLEGTEPALVEEAFSDKPDWPSLDPAFLDDTPPAIHFARPMRTVEPAATAIELDGRARNW